VAPQGQAQAGATAAAQGLDQAQRLLGQAPLAFVANVGQAGAAYQYVSFGGAYQVALSATEAALTLSRPADTATAPPDRAAAAGGVSAVLHMRLVGGQAAAPAVGQQPVAAPYTFIDGQVGARPAGQPAAGQIGVVHSDGSASRTYADLPAYGQLAYHNVYDGIDVVYHGQPRQLEYDFVVAPGADPGAIALAFTGADRVGLDAGGALELETRAGTVTQARPFAYQEVNGARQEVASRFVLHGAQVGFQVGAYDPGRPLVIDPTVVYAFPFYNPNNVADIAWGIAADGAGNSYICGQTGNGLRPPDPNANNAAFVEKHDMFGGFVWRTEFRINGAPDNIAFFLDVDGQGRPYVTGTFNDYPDHDLFALRMTMGGGFDWVNRYYTVNDDIGYGLRLGVTNDVWVTGQWDGNKSVVLDLNRDNGGVICSAVFQFNGATTTAIAVSVDGNNDPYVTGRVFNGGGNWLPFVNLLNQNCLPYVHYVFNTPSGFNSGEGIDSLPNGDTYVTGRLQNDLWLLKVDFFGNIIYNWDWSSGGGLGGDGVRANANGDAFVSGYIGNGGEFDALVVHFNGGGNGVVDYATLPFFGVSSDFYAIALLGGNTTYEAGVTVEPDGFFRDGITAKVLI
jgi:hypothetical protein